MSARFNTFRAKPRGGGGSYFGKRRHGNKPFTSSQGISKSRFKGQKIDTSRFINKAKERLEETDFTPQHSFSDFSIAHELKENITNKGYNSPTPIQDQAIEPALAGRDIIGIANTGTGKTAAFLIPLIHKVFHDRTQRVLIVTPTRELAVQITDEFKSFTTGMGLYSTLCIGGVSILGQIKEIRKNPHFIIGTPGRLKDLIQEHNLNLGFCNNVVLDEVDRMVDIGFIKDIKYLISLLPRNRQSLFFSATISSEIREIIDTFVNNPVTVSVKTQETSDHVKQDIVKVNGKNKIDTLVELLYQEEFQKVLIFGRTKWGVQKLSDILIKRGFKAAPIHGNKSQGQRQRALNQFKNNEIQILLATDVVSRGLDIDNVTHVINYDQPATYDDYVHRIGRTGRANKHGVALTFVE